jgi:hypothetical protein
MSLDTELQTKLTALAVAAISGTPVQQNYASTDKIEPRVWYQRRNGNTELLLSGAGDAGIETVYEVEIDALDPDQGGTLLLALVADASAGGLNGFRGNWGSSVVLGSFVEDVADDFQPRGLDLDDGYHVFAFQLRVMQ